MHPKDEVKKVRKTNHPVDPLFISRWSPRAMSGESISDEELMTLFEAAQWAPSASNNQPWRFFYAKRDTPYFEPFFNLLIPFNQSWCSKAAVLVIACSKTQRSEGKPIRTHSFDTGAAWMSLALQASIMGLVAHGMEGFDYDKARETLLLPADIQVDMMIAIGHRGAKELLPDELIKRETPSLREPLESRVKEGFYEK